MTKITFFTGSELKKEMLKLKNTKYPGIARLANCFYPDCFSVWKKCRINSEVFGLLFSIAKK